MKYLCIALIIIAGCAPTEKELVERLDELKSHVEIYENQLSMLKNTKAILADEIENLKITKAIKTNTAKYFIEIELSQSHFSLNFDDHMKDAMNTTSFEIAVDKDLYETSYVGQHLLKEFRGGSFLLKGSIGDWVLKVKNKRIGYGS